MLPYALEPRHPVCRCMCSWRGFRIAAERSTLRNAFNTLQFRFVYASITTSHSTSLHHHLTGMQQAGAGRVQRLRRQLLALRWHLLPLPHSLRPLCSRIQTVARSKQPKERQARGMQGKSLAPGSKSTHVEDIASPTCNARFEQCTTKDSPHIARPVATHLSKLAPEAPSQYPPCHFLSSTRANT